MSSYLANSPADVLRWLLVYAEQGADPTAVNPANGVPVGAWPVYASFEPNVPDECVTVYDTEGVSDGRAMVDGSLFQHYGVQVRVRSKRHDDGWTKAAALREFLATGVLLTEVAVGGALYLVHCCSGIGVVIPLGKDSGNSRRSLFTLNLFVTLKQLS